MNKSIVQLGAAILVVATATVSLTAAPRPTQAADPPTLADHPDEIDFLPAVALVAAGGLVGAFALGAAQGYLEGKNAQQAANPAPHLALADRDAAEMVYVLD